jgi:TRAP-type C4-dicarboxylate transport system substrate-binding protein
MKRARVVMFVLLGLMLVFSPFAGSCAKTALAEPIKLTLSSIYPEQDPMSLGMASWAKKIEQETIGRVHFTAYWGGAIANPREGLTQIRSGVYDVGQPNPQFAAGGFPIAVNMQSFFHGTKSLEASRLIYSKIYSKYPEVSAEYSAIKTLGIYSGCWYNLHTVKKPVRKLEDMRGMSLRSGAVPLKVLQELGVEGVNLPMGETYVSLQKGIVDGAFAPNTNLKMSMFVEVTKYTTDMRFALGPFIILGMNLDRWNSLPPDIQQVFEDNKDFLSSEIERVFLEQDQIGMDFAIERGHEFIDLQPEELDKLNALLRPYALQKAAELDAKGLPGTEIYKEVQRLIAE